MELIKYENDVIVEFHEYDFFMIVSAGRFNENDLWLAEQIKRKNRMFYFIRTKIDIDLMNAKDDDPGNFNESETLEKIRENTRDELRKLQSKSNLDLHEKDFKIFLIGGKLQNYRKWDFPVLIDSLTEDFPKLKRQAVVFLVNTNSKNIIKKKADALRNDVWRYVASSACGGTIPIPFFSLIPDSFIMKTCYSSYQCALGLDRQSLMTIAQTNGTTLEELEKHMLSTPWSKFFLGAQAMAATSFLIEVAEEGAKNTAKTAVEKMTTLAMQAIPVIGSIVGALASGSTMYYRLHKLIDEMEKAAIAVLDFVTNMSIKKV